MRSESGNPTNLLVILEEIMYFFGFTPAVIEVLLVNCINSIGEGLVGCLSARFKASHISRRARG